MAFTILPIATRQAGKARTVSTVVPPPPTNTGYFRIDLTGLALQDEPDTTEIAVTVDRSTDGGATWVRMIGVVWRGNNGVPFRFPPHVTLSADGIVGQLVSAEFTTNARVRYGVQGDWVVP